MGKSNQKHQKLKVDIITPLRYGGPGRWGDDLVRALKQEGIEARNIHNFWGIIKRFFWTDADIIHSTLPLTFNLQGKPIILTIHGDFRKERHPWSFMWPKAIKKAKKITVPSKFLKKELDLKQAIVIPNGIFPEDFKPVKHRKKEVLHIVTVTGFKFWDKARGVLELLKILEEVKKKTKQKFVFTVVGGGPFLEKIKEEANQYDVPVKFIGFHPNPKEILQKSDIFVYYSFMDNLPIAILEAMACGLPVITNDVGAVSEVTKPCKSHQEVVKKILENMELRSNFSMIKKFDWGNLIEKYREVHKDV